MDKNIKNNDTLQRMKSLMMYGSVNESHQNPYSTIEYQKVGADGKVYGIVREGTKYYIKVADNKPNLVTEDFNYIGGFRNRSDYAYNGFANAQKNFELKMMSIKESVNNNAYNAESWDLDKKENLVVEATENMRKEILREKQIMANVSNINENKPCCGDPFCDKADAQYQAKQNISKGTNECGDPEKANKKGKFKKASLKNTDLKEGEVLGWHDSNGNPKEDHYMDKSHGTKIGSSSPFDDAEGKQIDGTGNDNPKSSDMKNGVVEEGESMHDKDNQNTPSVGVGEIGDNAPFDGKMGKQIDEADDFEEDEPIDDDDVEGFGDEDAEGFDDEDAEGFDDEEGADDFGGEDNFDFDESDDDLDGEDDDDEDSVYIEDLEDRINSMEEMLMKIADAVGVESDTVDADDYEDEDIFDDDADDDEENDYELEVSDDEPELAEEGRNRVRVIESAGYRRAIRRMNEENRLDDFGRHPAYRKKVMTLPTHNHQEMPDYYDMNDDSVKTDLPYGRQIGDGAPFEVSPEEIANAIAESIIKLKKKDN